MSSTPSLILSMRGERVERIGGRREQVFDCRDGSIGRAEECDWVLAAEGVSRLHALVRFLNGLYFIEDRSTNGMLLNGASLRRGEPAALKQGDRLQIDTFEISVRLDSGTAEQAVSRENDDPVGMSSTPAPVSAFVAASGSASAAAHGIDALDLSLLLAPRRPDMSGDGSHSEGHADNTEGLIPSAGDVAGPGMSLDPLALFDAPSSYFEDDAAGAPRAREWNHTPAVSDRFRPPQIDAVQAIGPVLPDDWNATGSHVAPRPETQWDDSLLAVVGPNAPDVPNAAPVPAPLVAAPRVEVEPGASAQPAAPVTGDSPTATELPGATGSTAPGSAVSAQPAQPAQPAPPAAPASPDLSEMFHIAVDAMMDVLRARAELKNSFRLPATLIQRSENNPLKFAPTAQEAVKKLIAPPENGFLSGSAALNDAATDIRNHQMAMLAGMRSAFQSLLGQFDPARIDAAEGPARRLSLGGRPRHWERYKQHFDSLTGNPDECFQRLFGDEFARAYEEQLARLKRHRD